MMQRQIVQAETGNLERYCCRLHFNKHQTMVLLLISRVQRMTIASDISQHDTQRSALSSARQYAHRRISVDPSFASIRSIIFVLP